MTRFTLPALALAAACLLFAAQARSQDSPRQAQKESAPTKATYLITGLHCPPCTKTVESSLRNVKGVRSVKVDWKAKNANLEFDETVLPAQKLAQVIADTPHMMGGNSHYGGWLGIKVPELTDDASAKQVKAALGELKGVKEVATYPKQHLAGVAFDKNGKLTTRELIEALSKAGIKAENY